MTETWIPFAIKRPGPPQKLGYGGTKYRGLNEIEGEVKHSTEGSLQAALGELDKLTRGASWHGTIDHDGTLYQHYPLEAICWHGGGPGDRSFDTSFIGNLTLLGFEHVDRLNGVQYPTLTPKQQTTTVRITEFVRSVCPHVAASPPTLKRNLWEHGWISATACPSGLIPWQSILTELAKGDFMSGLSADEQRDLYEKTKAIHAMLYDKVGGGYPAPLPDGSVDMRRFPHLVRRVEDAAVAAAHADAELDTVLAELGDGAADADG